MMVWQQLNEQICKCGTTSAARAIRWLRCTQAGLESIPAH
jgi:hypothetical protein